VDSDDEDTYNHKELKKEKTRNKKKKNFYSEEDNISSDMSEDDETNFLFMCIETQNNVAKDNEEKS
jgi:hypothetical protein